MQKGFQGWLHFSQTTQPKMIPGMLAKTMQCIVLPILSPCAVDTIIFNLWMSHIWLRTFTMVVNFVDDEWQPRHVTVGLFEVLDTLGVALVEIAVAPNILAK